MRQIDKAFSRPTKDDIKQLQSLLFTSFKRVLKEKGIYHYILQRECYRGERFNWPSSSLRELPQTGNPNRVYDAITIGINILIQFYIEPYDHRMDVLSRIGQEVFDIVGTTLFPDSYIRDMEELERATGHRGPQNEEEAAIFPLFLKKRADGYEGSFDDFMQTIHDGAAEHGESLRSYLRRIFRH